MTARQGNRLVVIPSEPLEAYERAGVKGILQGYFNPTGLFAEVYALSPLEPRGPREMHGMTVIGGSPSRVARALRELAPDVVRAYGGYWASDFACRNRVPGVPVLVSVHDPHPSMVHRSVATADLVLCTSRAVDRAVLKRGARKERLRRLPNRIDTNVFRPIRDAAMLQEAAGRFPSGRRYVLHVGRKSKEKNLPTVIRALALLPKDYAAVFVGRGEPASFQRLARKVGVAERCFWVESVENDQLPLWYSWCDCMCTPSLWEGFGTVFIEAAACGAAVVTSDIAPMNEYLAHGTSAHLVKDYQDPRALAAAIRAVSEDGAYRQALSAGALEAAKAFDRPRIDALEAGIYREALGLTPRELSPRDHYGLMLDNSGRKLRTLLNWPHRAARRYGRRLIRAGSPPDLGVMTAPPPVHNSGRPE